VTTGDGSVYTGLYRNGVREGSGRFIWPAGQVEDHLYQSGSLVSKVVYSGRNAPDGNTSGGVAPTLPFLDAFLASKAVVPSLPESSASSSSSSSAMLLVDSDNAVSELDGALKLPDKLTVRTIDEEHVATAAAAIKEVLGKDIAVKIDWESINAGKAPRKSIYTLDFEKSLFRSVQPQQQCAHADSACHHG
jgi:hypothetical protein